MLGPRQQKLVDALKSGKFKKCCGALQKGDSYCCLGVATKLAEDDGIKISFKDGNCYTDNVLEPSVQEYYKFYSNGGKKDDGSKTLWLTNDHNSTFEEVIKDIESGGYFSEPV